MTKFQENWYWYTRKFTMDNLRWKIAYLIPRKIALLVFVRVFSCIMESPDAMYGRIYRAWENGAGK